MRKATKIILNIVTGLSLAFLLYRLNSIRQGNYEDGGGVNLNNLAIVAFIAMVVSVVLSYVVIRRADATTTQIRRVGLIASLMFIGFGVLLFFLIGWAIGQYGQ